MIPATFFGELNYVLSVKLPNIECASKEKQQKYVLSTIAKNKRDSVFRIEIVMDSEGKIMDVDFDYFTQEDIPDEEMQDLIKLGEYYTKSRIQSFLIQNHKKKIYPNDYCPCGSGKKYKKCCGR